MSTPLPPGALVIADQVYCPALYADGQPFVFTVPQTEFLMHLEETKNIETACVRMDRPVEWARAFLSSRKFRAFRNATLRKASVLNGITIEWLAQFFKDAAAGYREWQEATCEICHEQSTFSDYEIESYRQDDMTLKVQCPVCFQPVIPQIKHETFKPDREQLVAAQELAARVWPKIERVAHEFAEETFIFQAKEAV